jgi:Fic family protein
MTHSSRQNQILNLLLENQTLSAVSIADILNIGLRTIQRDLTVLMNLELVQSNQESKNTNYSILPKGRINCELESRLLGDQRLEELPTKYFDFELFATVLKVEIFDENDQKILESAKSLFQQKESKTTELLWKKEMQRLIVEFSWKSSKIEGNTYTLLETEELLNHKSQSQSNHTELENNMIINHKLALDYVFGQQQNMTKITTKNLLEIHKLLTNSLNIKSQFRNHSVGITASLYQPLDNQHQIKEVVDKLFDSLILKTPFEQAFLVSLLVAYTQPFEDGNKRTSRTLTNAILFGNNLPMISYRSTSVKDYKEAILAFYEFGSIVLFKKIFVDQVDYFSKNYF